MAAVAVAGVASAQVTISGVAAVSYQQAVGGVVGFDRTDANLNFAATEDLGGGLSASASMSFDLGTRQSTALASTNSAMSLSGGFGTVAYSNVAAGSSRLSGGESLVTSINGAMGGDLAVSQVKYTLPTLVDGLTLAVDATDLVRVQGSTAITYTVGYKTGPVSVTYDQRDSDKRQRVLVSFDAGVAMISASSDINADDENEFAITAPMGGATVGMHWFGEGNNSGTAVAASYALSKRTSLTISYANLKNPTDATYNGNTSRIRLGHTF